MIGFTSHEPRFSDPFQELESSNQFRPHPNAFPHLFWRDSLSPAAPAGFREIRERASVNNQRLHPLIDCAAGGWHEASANASNVPKLVPLINTHQQRFHTIRARSESANNKLL